MKKILITMILILSGFALADGPVQLIDMKTGTSEQKLLIGVPKIGPSSSVTVSNFTATGTVILPSPFYMGEIYSGNIYASNSITLNGTSLATVTGSNIGTNAAAFRAAISADKTTKNTFVLFGDSLTLQGASGFESGALSSQVRGYFNWARFYMDNTVAITTNLGVGGNTTGDMLARISTVLTNSADYVMVCAGANDSIQRADMTNVVLNLAAIATNITSVGKTAVFMTIPSFSNSAASSDSTQRLVRAYANSKLLDFPKLYPNVHVINIEDATTDALTSDPAAGMVIDTVHWSTVAAERIGKIVAGKLDSIVSKSPRYFNKQSSPLTVIGNVNFTNSAQGWTRVNTGLTTLSVIASTNQINENSLSILVTNNTSPTLNSYDGGVSYTENISSGRFASGTVFKAQADISWNITEVGTNKTFRPLLWIRTRNVDNSFNSDYYAFTGASGEDIPLTNYTAVGRAVVRTPDITVLGTVDRIYVYVGFSGMQSGTCIVNRLDVSKVIP